MTRTTQQETLKFEARQRRLERFEASIGEIKTLLSDADPKRVTMNLDAERSPALMQDLATRWAAIRPSLEGAAVLDNNESLRDDLTDLLKGVNGVLYWDRWVVSDWASAANYEDSYQQGVEAHNVALESLKKVAALLRASEKD